MKPGVAEGRGLRTGTGLALTCFTPGANSFNYTSGDTYRDVVTLVRIDALTINTSGATPAAQHARTGAAGTGR